MNNHSHFLFALSLICLGCSQADPQAGTEPVEYSRSAARTHALMESTDVPPAEAGQTIVSGAVVDIAPNLVNLKLDQASDAKPYATAPGVDVWEDGKLVGLDSLESGDRVDLFSEQRGNRIDGYQSLVVRINIASRASDDEADTKDYSRTMRGVIVEADSTAVRLRNEDDPNAKPTIMPFVRLVKVTKAGETGGISLLSPGDQVELTIVSVGNRMDGYIDTATEIAVE